MTMLLAYDMAEQYRHSYGLDDVMTWPLNAFAMYSQADWAITTFEENMIAYCGGIGDTGEWEEVFDITIPENTLMDLIDTFKSSPFHGPAIDVWTELLDIFWTKLNKMEGYT